MYEKSEGIFYHSAASLENYFYSNSIHSAAEKMSHFLAHKGSVHIFSDATLKSNRFPNGLAIIQSYDEAILTPALLRDPGCGFLLFKLNATETQENDIKNQLHEFGHALEANYFTQNTKPNFIKDILLHGMLNQDTKHHSPHFVYEKFTIDEPELFINDADLTLIANDLSVLTNTIEIKKVMSDKFVPDTEINPGDYIGFIHTGSNVFPKLFNENFFQFIADFSYYNGLASVETIRQGIYGVPLSSELGYRYYQWIKAAMNFCLVKRWLIFSALAKFMKDKKNIDLEIINDRVHAGIFLPQRKKSDTQLLIQSRGVQEFQSHPTNHRHNFFLLAGQRETVSYLLTPKLTVNTGEYLCHGTSYAYQEDLGYHSKFNEKQAHDYLTMCQSIKANTTLEQDKCLAYTYNIQQQIHYFMNKEICETILCLMPLANYFGASLIRAEQYVINHG